MFDEAFIDALAKAVAPRLASLIHPHLKAAIVPRYLNLEQAADYLSTTPDGVRGMLRANVFPARKIGARLFIDVEDIDAAMNDAVHYCKTP
ncbi:MAG TPA: helix-turn-helix domain-containing protein [Bryobacteraceae bacterium]|jgi:hypothetical protein